MTRVAIAVAIALSWGSAATASAAGQETVEVRLRRFADSLAQGVARIGEHPRYQVVAVLPFVEHGERTKEYGLGPLLGYTLRASLARDYGLPVVPATAIRKAMESLAEQGPTVGPEQARSVGAAVKARAVIAGNVSDAGDHFAVSASVFDVTGEAAPLEHRLVRIPARDLVEAAEDAQVLRTRSGALWRSLVAPGWGQLYTRAPVKGVAFAGVQTALIAGAVTAHVLGGRAEDRYRFGLRETVSEGDAAETRYAIRNVFVSVAAAVWVYGAVDAWLGGADPDATPTLVAAEQRPPPPGAGGSALTLSWGF